MSQSILPPTYFEDLYAGNRDPWGFETRWYEKRKYALTLAALPKPRYRRALEPGCSIGVLTELLAQRCDELVATDIVDAALTQTRNRLRQSTIGGSVDCRTWAFGTEWTLGRFDLIVLSEVGYYLEAETLCRGMQDAAEHLESGGTLICVHWRHEVVDYPLSGDAVHAIARRTPGLTAVGNYSDADMVIDVFTTADNAASVATAEGLVAATNDQSPSGDHAHQA